MADNSFTYCDSDEEVFFGKVTDKEKIKSTTLGQYYHSPDVKCGTPRPKAENLLRRFAVLPDILKRAAHRDLLVKDEEHSINIEQIEESAQSTHFTSVNSSFSENDSDTGEVGVDNVDNSVHIISDDENHIGDEHVYSNKGDQSVSMFVDKQTMAEVCKVGFENILSDQECKEKIEETSELGNINCSSDKIFEPKYNDGTIVLDNSNISYDNKLEHNAIEMVVSSCTNFLPNQEYKEKLTPDESKKHANNECLTQEKNEPQTSFETDVLSINACDNSVSSIQEYSFKRTEENTELEQNSNILLNQENEAEADEMNNFTNSGCLSERKLGCVISAETIVLDNGSVSFDDEFSPTAEPIKLESSNLLTDQEFKFNTTTELGNSEYLLKHEIKTATDSFNQECQRKTISETSGLINTDFLTNQGCDPSRLESKMKLITAFDQIQDSIKLEIENLGSVYQKDKVANITTGIDKSSLDSGLYNFDSTLLNSVSDSILNLSHGSSISSPLSESNNKGSPGIQTNVIYEDISCDGEQMFDSNIHLNSVIVNDDLHMSVDEIEYQQKNSVSNAGFTANISPSSLYKSCLNESSGSSYFTACNRNSENLSVSQQSNSFKRYRENANDSVLLQEVNKIKLDVLEIDDKNNKNENSFEMILQNRQNSFTRAPETKPAAENMTENVKPKFMSKLPVYHSSVGFLKPSKLHVQSDSLKTKNYKWAKNLPKSNFGKVDSSFGKSESLKTATLKQNVYSACSEAKILPMPPLKSTKIASKTPNSKSSTQLLNKAKTPTETKTPAALPQLMRPETKTPKSLLKPPSKKVVSSGKKGENNSSPCSSLKEKDRYKNVISPIHAYITGTPVVLQKKAHVVHEETHVVVSSTEKMESRIPMKNYTPLKIPKAVQKLYYGNPDGQENVDPNYTRDTLPPRVLHSATAVFLKEPAQPINYLPKIGEGMKKLLDTPRPKVTIHQGRVRESPKTRGVLIPSTNLNSPEEITNDFPGRISVRVVKSAEKTNTLK